MVRALTLLATVSLSIWAEPGTKFLTECTKTKIYQGEQTTCHFVLYAMEDRVEVEVAKFPEFRGFWSENSALRQGPMLLLPEPRFPGLRKALIGTYHLFPMVGGADPTIVPMRVVFRSMNGQEEHFSSESPKLTVLPLPKPPQTLAPFFQSAVGQFILRSESPIVRFVPQEPTSLRFLLSGAGNFPEVNSLALSFPDSIKVLSQKNSSLGSGGFQTKLFEVLITVESENPVDIPPVMLSYFNPFTRSYEATASDPIRLEPLPRPAEVVEKEQIPLRPIEAQWTSSSDWEQGPAFWILQMAIAALWIGAAGWTIFRILRERRRRDPRVKLRNRWKALFETPGEDALGWLRSADELLFDTLVFLSGRKLTTRREVLAFAKKRWGDPTAASTASVFRAYEEASFSPTPSAPPPKDRWVVPLRSLKAALKI